MGRIFLSAAHGGLENGLIDPGSIVSGTTEAREMILLRDLLMAELRSRSLETLAVPDDLSMQQTLDWINTRGRNDDVALELHADSAPNPLVRGATAFYINQNDTRKRNADLLLLGITKRLPSLPNRGSKPDTTVGVGNLAFCRQLVTPSLLLQIGFLTNPDDRFILQNQRLDLALGIADGIQSWLKDNGTAPIGDTYPAITINLNSQSYGEQGILVNGNAYIPIDLVDRLGVDLSVIPTVRRLAYRSVVFVKAIELRDFNVSVNWDTTTRTVLLKSILKICPGSFDRIIDHGKTTELQLMMFLKTNNELSIKDFPEIGKLYREESAIEGVDHDIAFSQMCLETNFLRFGSLIKPSQNNFAGMGTPGGGPEGASFDSARLGVRAHIQLLKAYASTEPLVQESVNPRFRFITRGIAPLVGQLSGRWQPLTDYGDRILGIVRRLYENSSLL
ncbi:MAG: N-acetylmuramoyl-L-alanine amidase [Alkalinema sp. FL-bin-369]|nr:N-acetylmuramoyl-L-alanine amidase [Leptolyngbyaceae cyanobacterium LF-bin-369]